MISPYLWPLFSLTKRFQDVSHTNQYNGARHDARDTSLGVKQSHHEHGKKGGQDGPNDEYVECSQGDTSVV